MPLVQLDTLEMHYQTMRQGEQVLLALHPSTVPGQMFTWAVPKSDRFLAYIPDQRGHGKTDNPEGLLHMDLLTQDMFNFVEAMELDSFHAVGYSMGAAVLLHMAVQQPTMFKSLALIGTNFHPPTEAQFTEVSGSPLEGRTGLTYEILHPERGMQNGWAIGLDDLKHIICPTILIGGDRDPISHPEDLVAMYRTLPDGRLLIVPHCGHFGYHGNAMVKAFLEGWYADHQ